MKWIEYDYVCNADKGINLHKKVEYNEANLAIAEVEACNGEYTITEDGVETGGSFAELTRKSIGAAAEALTDDVALAFGLNKGATIDDAFIKAAAGAAKVSMNEPTAENNVAAGFSIGKMWLRPGYELENATYGRHESDFEPYACTVGKAGQVFTVAGNGDDKTFSASTQVPSVEGWVYAVIAVNGGATSAKATFGDTEIVLQNGSNVVCVPFAGAAFVFEATYSTANAASKGSIAIENLTVIDKAATFESGAAGGCDIAFDNITDICKTNAPFETHVVPTHLYQHMHDGDWQLVYGVSDDVRDAFDLSQGANPDAVLLRLEDARNRIGDVKFSARADLSDNWLLCNGTPISKNRYPELYSLFENNPDKKYYSVDMTVFSIKTHVSYGVANGIPFLFGVEPESSSSTNVHIKIVYFDSGFENGYKTKTLSINMGTTCNMQNFAGVTIQYNDGTYGLFFSPCRHPSNASYPSKAAVCLTKDLDTWYTKVVGPNSAYDYPEKLAYVKDYWVIYDAGYCINGNVNTKRNQGFWYLANNNMSGNFAHKAIYSNDTDQYATGVQFMLYSGGYYCYYYWRYHYNNGTRYHYWFYTKTLTGTWSQLKNSDGGTDVFYDRQFSVMFTEPFLCLYQDGRDSNNRPFCYVFTYNDASLWRGNGNLNWNVNVTSYSDIIKLNDVGDYLTVLYASTSNNYPSYVYYRLKSAGAQSSGYFPSNQVFTSFCMGGDNAVTYFNGQYVMFGWDTDYCFKAKYAKDLSTGSYSANIIVNKLPNNSTYIPKLMIIDGVYYLVFRYYNTINGNNTECLALYTAADPTGEWSGPHVIAAGNYQVIGNNFEVYYDGTNIIVDGTYASGNTTQHYIFYAPIGNFSRWYSLPAGTLYKVYPDGGCCYYTYNSTTKEYVVYVCEYLGAEPIVLYTGLSLITPAQVDEYFMYKYTDKPTGFISDAVVGMPAVPLLNPDGCYAYIKAEEDKL